MICPLVTLSSFVEDDERKKACGECKYQYQVQHRIDDHDQAAADPEALDQLLLAAIARREAPTMRV